MMYSYTAMKAAEDKEETKTKADKDTKQSRRGNKNDKGTERADSTITKE